ncbi:MAG TPA: CinA family protein [Mycobacteriales bacterium]|nr:CinA family protein [Mycobacteriales bacterium]
MTRPVDVGAIHRGLAARGATVAVAESITAGLVCAALTGTPGSSATFRGGLVVYATDLKHALAGVPTALLEAHGPVSAPVAAALAGGVAERLGATFGLALTGVAGPDPADGVPVGTVYLGLSGLVGPAGTGEPAGSDGPVVRRLALAGGREAIRAEAVAAALDLLWDVVRESR